jgi:hypothetical protein
MAKTILPRRPVASTRQSGRNGVDITPSTHIKLGTHDGHRAPAPVWHSDGPAARGSVGRFDKVEGKTRTGSSMPSAWPPSNARPRSCSPATRQPLMRKARQVSGPEQAAQHIAALLRDPELRRSMGRRARARAAAVPHVPPASELARYDCTPWVRRTSNRSAHPISPAR